MCHWKHTIIRLLPPRKIETSPRMISQFASFTSFQVNVNASGQNIVGDAANECSISVNPIDGSKKTIAWRQFNNVTSNFRQGGWGYTTDGGCTGPSLVSWKIASSAATR